MLNKIFGIRLLILAGLVSVAVVPALLIAPDMTLGQTRVQGASWTGIVDWLLGRKKQRPISRGDLCLVSPNGTMYSSQPLFLWKGQLKKIAVSKAGSKYNNFWNKDISESKNLAIYTGEKALQPGIVYEWKGFIADDPTISAKFQVMNEQQRQVITDELNILEKRLQREGVNKEKIALEKANYFVEKGLWSDVLQQVYSVPNPSKQFLQQTKDLSNKLCEIEKNQPKGRNLEAVR